MAHAELFYGTVAAFNTWAAARGFEALDDAIPLTRATDYLEEKYRTRWKGVRAAEIQDLSWPRISEQGSELGILDNEGYEVDPLVVPELVELATYEAARRINDGDDLQADLPRGGAIKLERNLVVGAVEQEKEYFSSASNRTRIPAIEGLLRGLLIPGNVGVILRA